jgi:hypothetical protein
MSERLLADYTITPTQLYHRVLSRAPSISTAESWRDFKGLPKAALYIPDDANYQRFDILYRAEELDRPLTRPLLTLLTREGVNTLTAFLEILPEELSRLLPRL